MREHLGQKNKTVFRSVNLPYYFARFFVLLSRLVAIITPFVKACNSC